MDSNWDLNNHDRLKLYDVTEKNVLDLIAKNKKPFEYLELLKDESIPILNRGKLPGILLILKDKGFIKVDEFGLRYSMTRKGKIQRMFDYPGWPFIGVALAILAILTAIWLAHNPH